MPARPTWKFDFRIFEINGAILINPKKADYNY